MYKKGDTLNKPRKRPNEWRAKAADFYSGSLRISPDLEPEIWCHMAGRWCFHTEVKAAHIVPFFLELGGLADMLFGARSQSLTRPENALLLSTRVKSWFDKYQIVIVPADPLEIPIRRWRTDVISTDIRNSVAFAEKDAIDAIGEERVIIFGKDLDGRELVFRSDARPASRFMYFHFVMALIRIKDLDRPGWQDAWARYYQERPFPTPGPYMRKSMLLALATHFQTADMKVVESWIADHGFGKHVELAGEQAEAVARRG